MTDKLQTLEEQTAIMRLELMQMSDELYAQQKELVHLRQVVDSLRHKIQMLEADGGILKAEEDRPPPHY